MAHPFKAGQKVRCIRGTDCEGYVLTGDEVTVRRTFVGPPSWGSGDGPLPGMEHIPGVELEEHRGDAYTANRFEAIPE